MNNSSKELVFVHDWIGPYGPIQNYRTPNLYDLASRTPGVLLENGHIPNEQNPLVMDIKEIIKCRTIPSWEIDSIGSQPFLYEIMLSPKWCYDKVTLTQPMGVFENVALSQRVLDKVRGGQGYIVLTNIYESFLDDEMFFKIHKYFSFHQIPLRQVIYLTNCINCKEIYNQFCLRHGREPKLKCEYINIYVMLQKQGLFKSYDRYEGFEKRTDTYSKPKIFLNLNRRHRLHRHALLVKFIEKDLLKFTDMSMSKERTIEEWVRDIQYACKKYSVNMHIDDITAMYDTLPWVLDSENFHRFPVEDNLLDTATLYDNTYISLVSETNFESQVIHMTEKTFKPILFKQAFIIVGPPKTLHYLKQMGFQTFEDYWDESYDSEYDHYARMNMITDVCSKIASWSQSQLDDFLRNTKQRREHNFEVFKNMQPTDLLNFQQTYGAVK